MTPSVIYILALQLVMVIVALIAWGFGLHPDWITFCAITNLILQGLLFAILTVAAAKNSNALKPPKND